MLPIIALRCPTLKGPTLPDGYLSVLIMQMSSSAQYTTILSQIARAFISLFLSLLFFLLNLLLEPIQYMKLANWIDTSFTKLCPRVELSDSEIGREIEGYDNNKNKQIEPSLALTQAN